MQARANGIAAALIAALVLSVWGCAETEPSRFYILTSLDSGSAEARTASDKRGVALGVGPIKLPEYVNRPEIVTRKSANELELLEFDKWAEPMKDNFTRVMTDNLSILLRTDRIAVHPWRSTTPIQRQVTMEVIRFDRGEDDVVYLTALWSLYGKDGRRLLLTRKSTYRQAVAGPGAENVAAAMSTVVAELSREVADAIEK